MPAPEGAAYILVTNYYKDYRKCGPSVSVPREQFRRCSRRFTYHQLLNSNEMGENSWIIDKYN